MYVLITWGAKLGGTEGIAHILGDALQERGFDVLLRPAAEVRGIAAFDAVLVGGALYANRWHPAARRFVSRHVRELRHVPVWFFSSGPLDDSAARTDIPPTPQVAALMDRVGARGHVTFGGRLAPDVRGFPASAMARTHSGDWRDPERVRAWAATVAAALPTARPGLAVDPPARALPRLLAHGATAAALSTALLGALIIVGLAAALRGIVAPVVFALVARHYFQPAGARQPIPTALTFGAITVLLDAALLAALQRPTLLAAVSTWLPLALATLAAWATGALMSTMPWPRPPRASAAVGR